jgi:hypothetical protein
MKRFVTRALIVAAATLGIVFAQVAPASATVHEIVGQWCAGRGELFPRGLSGGSNADNVAKPLFASGFATTVPFDGSAGPGLLIEFNYDNPNAKVVGTGVFVVIDPTVPLYVEVIEPNPDFPAFQRCPRLATG